MPELRGKKSICPHCSLTHPTRSIMETCAIRHDQARQALAHMRRTGSGQWGEALHARAEREAQERAQKVAEGEITPETLPSPTFEEFISREGLISEKWCGGSHEGSCLWHEEFDCLTHLWMVESDKYCVYRGRVFLRMSNELKRVLGIKVVAPPWRYAKTANFANRYLERTA